MLSEIDSQNILKTAMAMVRSARSTIRMTMEAREELESPIPEPYFALLREKMEAGVMVTRVGFGDEKDFEELASRVRIDSPQYAFVKTRSDDYRRMLLVDDRKLLYSRTDATGKHVFYSEDSAHISEYVHYFETLRLNG